MQSHWAGVTLFPHQDRQPGETQDLPEELRLASDGFQDLYQLISFLQLSALSLRIGEVFDEFIQKGGAS
jgi:hypothetical protein